MKALIIIILIQIFLTLSDGYFKIGNRWFEFDWSAKRYLENQKQFIKNLKRINRIKER